MFEIVLSAWDGLRNGLVAKLEASGEEVDKGFVLVDAEAHPGLDVVVPAYLPPGLLEAGGEVVKHGDAIIG